MPVWGRAALESLSILIETRDRPCAAPPGSGRPVSGAPGGAFVGVVVAAAGFFFAFALASLPPHAVTASAAVATIATAAASRRERITSPPVPRSALRAVGGCRTRG